MAYAGSGIGSMIMGEAFDRLGSYDAMLIFFEVIIAIALLLILFLPPYHKVKAAAASGQSLQG